MLPTLPKSHRKLKPRPRVPAAPPVGDRHARTGLGSWCSTPKCPLCRWPLVARMGKRRPYLHCQCTAGREEV
jgi:hypothetical protein